jgi:maleate isomerase
MSCELDRGPAARAAIGLVTLATDMTIEPELQTFLPRDGVAVYSSRIPMANVATRQTLLDMKAHITGAVSLILPYSKLDVVAFGCTSGSMAIGPAEVAAKIHETRPGVACSNPVSAALKGLRTLGRSRIALLTPYVDEVNAVVEAYVENEGFDIVAKGSFKQPGDPQIVCIPPQAIFDAGVALGSNREAEALFISCTGLRVSSIIAPLEDAIGKPVVTSNQALAWDCLRLAGCDDRVRGFGKLMTM